MKRKKSELRRYWSDDERKALKKLYPCYLRGEISKDDMIRVFNRSMSAIQRRASEMGYAKSSGECIDWEEYKKQCQTLNI